MFLSVFLGMVLALTVVQIIWVAVLYKNWGKLLRKMNEETLRFMQELEDEDF